MRPGRNLWIVAMASVLAWAWVAPAGAQADLERGAARYDLCSQCHGDQGEGNPLALAPTIAGFPEWYVVQQLQYFRSGVRGKHPDDMGGLRMYPMSLSLKTDEDIRSVSAYVASLPRMPAEPSVEGGNPQQGATRYALCAACHGPDGGGNEQMKSPLLAGASDWYLLTTLQKYKAGIRGSNPANPNGAVMRSFAGQLDDQAMLDLIAYINTLSGGR